MSPPAASGAGDDRQPTPQRVWLLTALLFAAGFLVYRWGLPPMGSVVGPLRLPWWAMAMAFAAADIFVVHLHSRRDAVSFSLSEIPLVVGLFLASPVSLVLGRVAGGMAALAIHRRQSGLKLTFNLGQFFLFEGVMPLMIFRLVLGAHSPVSMWGWAAAYCAVLSTNLFSGLAISLAGLVNQSMPLDTLALRALGGGLVAALGNVSLALVAVLIFWHDASSSWLLLVVAAVLYVAYRGYLSLSQTYSRLETLYGFTRAVNWSLKKTSILEIILGETRELMRAEIAEATLLPASPEALPTRTTLGPGQALETVFVVDTSAVEDVRAEVVRTGKGVLLARPIRDEALRKEMERRGLKDAVVAPLRSESGIVGSIMVANRMGDVGTFETEDLRLLETVTNHASVTLENRRLVDQLREEAAEKEHQSLHDNLTRLPNRTLFNERVERAIENARGTNGSVAVMLLDLDDFKEVNDTLGHHYGDLVLKEVGVRLCEVLRPMDTVARLGGDEFAVLIPFLDDAKAVTRVARRISHAFERNFEVSGLTLEVRSSVGIALFPEHGQDAKTLLQKADVAMYQSKAQRHGFEIYEAEKDQCNPRRLALMPDLRTAIQKDELEVYYQPQAGIRDRSVLGVEALLRWQHSEHGFVPPDEFVPMAEHTGLIRPMTLFVLRKAMQQCLVWQQAGIELGLAVNLSVRNLLDLTFPFDVARLLNETGFDPQYLTLEITESCIMADPGRMLAELKRLDELGVTLSIDDFGTGYSSLSYLSRLPVKEIKIDRSFVQHMTEDDNDAVIVQSVIDLGRNLGLRVVAEGIEDAVTWQRLADMGCDIAQGYFLGRPMPAAQLENWFVENGVAGSLGGGRQAGALDAPALGRVASVTPISRARRVV
jgi:diguanylate cyclase (GGDEF)-like protein